MVLSEIDDLVRAFYSYRKARMWDKQYMCAEEVYNNDLTKGANLLKDFREDMSYEIQTGGDMVKAYELQRSSYILEGKDNFESFMIGMEWDRNPRSRFWLPRRKQLEGKFGVASQIQSFIFEDKGVKLTLSTPPGCGKSTLIKFLLAFIAGKFPQSMNMYVSYSDGMVKMMMDAIMSLTMDDEYNFQEIFPLGKPDKSAEYNTIGYRRKGDAQTINLCSIGGSITGRTRANKFIITDDLVKNDEVARSPERLETLYQDYSNTISTRTIGDEWKEIMLGTIWSIYDPISREKVKYEGTPGYHFIALPVCDELGHSNFNYDGADGYTDEKIAKLKEKLDPVIFSCLYMQRGIQKEGMPFSHDKLKWYNGILPDGEPDNIFFYCDVAWGGGDRLAMPIAYQYGDDVFIHDVVFNGGDKSITKPAVVGKILQHQIKMGRFEANLGGAEYCEDVSKQLIDTYRYSCNLTSKRAPNNVSKEIRIEQHQDTIRNFYFRNDSEASNEYKLFMNEVEVFSFTSKNLHDDAPDSLAGLAAYRFDGHSKIVLGQRMF